MQYEIVIKGGRWCSCYTCLPQTVLAAQIAQKMAPGTGTRAPQMDLSKHMAKNNTQHKHTYKQ